MVALLALLSGSPGGEIGRDRAAAMLWPGSDEARARLALRQLLFRLRRMAPVFEADRGWIRLRVPVDVLEFEAAIRDGRAEDAASLYRGPFLDGFALPGSAEFDQWCDTERERLRRAAAGALGDMVGRAIGRGRWDTAATAALRWLDLEPYSEEVAGHAITAHAHLGDRAAALAIYEAFRQRLSTDLGTPPAPALERLVERVRRSPPPVGSAPQIADRSPHRLELPLVGREEEFARLTACWTRACAGRHQLVLLRGEPGIGKTRLAEEFSRRAAVSGATTLTCSAYQVEAGVPYSTLAGALRDALHAPGLGGVEDRTVAELSRIVPDYAGRFPAAEARAEGGLDAGNLRIMEAWRDLLDSLAHEAAVLLVVDDLTWADETSLAALHYGWRLLPDRPVMILATARGTGQDELGGAAGLVAAALREGEDTCTTLVLGPLDRSAVAAAATASADNADKMLDPAVLQRRSGGNPLFLVELLRAAAEGGAGAGAPTETIRLVALDRIGRLDPRSRALLQAAAILGRQFPLPLAASVAELPSRAGAAAVDALLSRGLLRQVRYGYDFVHDVVREVVRDSMGASWRAVLHERAFAEIRPDAADDDLAVGPERLGALAHHAGEAGLTAEAHRWHLRAGRAAISLYAPAEAVRALGRALEFATTPDERRHTWEAIGELARARSDFRGAAVAYREALAMADGEEDRLRLRLSLMHMGDRAGLLDTDDVEGLGTTLRPEAEAAGPETLGRLLLIMGETHARARSFERAAGYAIAAVDALRAGSSPRSLVRALILHAGVTAHASDGGDALAALEEAEQLALRHGLPLELSDVRIEKATELSRRGNWDAAIAGFQSIRGDVSEAPDWGNSAIACLNVADLHARRGDWEAAATALAEAERISERFDFPHVAVVAELNRALLEWLKGDRQAAVTAARQARDGAAALGLAAPAVAAAAIEALALLEAGEDGKAGRVLAAVAADDVAAPHPSWADDAELLAAARARLLAATGETDAARALLDGAGARASEPYAAALLGLERATLEQARAPALAAELAAAALCTFRELGATPLAERAAALASAAGAVDEPAAARRPAGGWGHRRQGPG